MLVGKMGDEMKRYESIKGEYLGNKWEIRQNLQNGNYLASIESLGGESRHLSCQRPVEYMAWFDERG